MANRMNFTKAAIEGLEAGPARARWHDTRQPGLVLTVTPKGAKTFYVYSKVKGAPVEYRLGPWPAMTVDLARKRAAEYLGRVAAGGDPAADRRSLAADPTFGELFAWYLEHHAKPHKATWQQDQAIYDRYLTDLGRRKVGRIARQDVRQLHGRLGERGTYAANRALWLIRQVFNQAIRYEMVTTANPAAGVEPFKEASRDRRLSRTEADAFLGALLGDHDGQARDFFLLALCTGARRSNLQAMRWDQLDWDAGTWRIPRTKNGTPQTLPLLDYELSLLRRRRAEVPGPWVFPGTGRTGHIVEPKKAWARILARAGLQDFRIHDLRRTLGSLAVDAGATREVIGGMLNHLSPQATAIYARLSLDPIREAKGKALAGVFATLRELAAEG